MWLCMHAVCTVCLRTRLVLLISCLTWLADRCWGYHTPPHHHQHHHHHIISYHIISYHIISYHIIITIIIITIIIYIYIYHDIYIIIYMCECMYVDLLCILDYIFMCKNYVCVHLSPVSPVLSPAKALTALAEIDLGALWPIGRFGQATRQGPQPLIHWIPKMESHEDISSMESWLLMDILSTY